MSYQFGHVDPEERLDHAEAPPPADGDYQPRRLLPGAMLAVGVMAVFAGGLWFAYHEGEKHAAGVAVAPGGAAGNTAGQVPLIRADTAPVKVKPDKAGGMNIPDKDDPIYSLRPGANPAEHILPPPEAPAPRPLAPPPPASPPVQTAETPAASAPKIEPGPPPLPAPPQVAPRAAPKPAPAAKPAAASGPPVRIQLASLRTPDQAREEWARLKHENGDLLGRFTAIAVRADLGERGVWYRIEAGPVGNKAAAIRLCKALKQRDLECQLVP